MKKVIPLFLLCLITLFTISCNQKKKEKEVASYAYTEKTAQSTPSSSIKLPGDWVKEGVECYGLLVAVDKEGKQIYGKPVKAEVVKIAENEIKMKALESVSLAETKGCTKMGIQQGDSWSEKDGDLFQTKEEAIAFLKKNKLYHEKLTIVPAHKK